MIIKHGAFELHRQVALAEGHFEDCGIKTFTKHNNV